MNLSYFVKSPCAASRSHAAWWASIANGSQVEVERTGHICTQRPVEVTVEYFLPCPAARKLDDKHITSPGLPSLAGALSGLENVIIAREEQITVLTLKKRYVGPRSTGAQITIVEG